VITRLGCGSKISLLGLMAPFSVREKGLAVAMGAVTQLRIMGGALGLSIVTSVMSTLLRRKLGLILDPEQLEKVLGNAREIAYIRPSELQQEVMFHWPEGCNLQLQILAGLAASQIVGVIIMWKQGNQIKVEVLGFRFHVLYNTGPRRSCPFQGNVTT